MAKKLDKWNSFHQQSPGCNVLDSSKEVELISALESGNFQAALQIIPKDTHITIGPDKLTPLHYACQHGRDDIVKVLINDYKYGISESCRRDGLTPTHLAAKYDHVHVLKVLTESMRQSLTSQSTKTGSSVLQSTHTIPESNSLQTSTPSAVCFADDNYGNSPLHTAAANGHLAVVKYLIDETQCTIASTNKDGHTTLHLAAKFGHLAVVKYLIDVIECNTTSRDERGRSPLYLAAENGQLNVVRYMITEKQCDAYSRTTKHWKKDGYDFAPGRTLLHTASREGHLNIVQYLFDEGKYTDMSRDEHGTTPIHLASQNGHLDVVKYLLDKQLADPLCPDEEKGTTPIHLASQKEHTAVMRFLTEEKQCDPMCRDKYRDTPLHAAALGGSLDVIKFFIAEKNCDPMCRGRWGRTPLHRASQEGHLDVIKYLIDEQQADPSCPDEEDSTTPLHLASENGHTAVVRFLTEEKQCDPMCRDKYRITPLHAAAHGGSLDIIKFFIAEKNCDPMCRGLWGRTPLHRASQEGHLDVIKYLIDEQQADPSCPDEEDSTTPLHLASKNGHTAVVRFLTEEKQCDPMCRNKYGSSPLDLACKAFAVDTAIYLISKGCIVKTAVHHQVSQQLRNQCLLYTLPKIYFVGNAGAGKSTLFRALQEENAIFGRFLNVGNVISETAGIVPRKVDSRSFGKVTMYDLAGHEEFHAGHEVLFESVSQAVVLIVIDLSEGLEQIRRSLVYWQLIITNATSAAGCHVHVIAVGSHADILTAQHHQAKATALSKMTRSCSHLWNLQHFDSVVLDCRKSYSDGIEKLRKLLEQSCKIIRIKTEFDCINCSLLNAFICESLPLLEACTFSDLLSPILSSKNPRFNPLKSPPSLYSACEGLNASGHLIFLKSKDRPEESWIIRDKKAVLSIVHGLLKGLKKSTSLGIVTHSLLEAALKQSDQHPDTDLVIQYMLRMGFCTKIEPQALQLLGGLDSTLPASERHFFFPALISAAKPVDIWQPSPRYTYSFGWCLQCTEEFHFFTPRFLQLLLVNLTCNYALVPQPTPPTFLESTSGCRLWKNGMRWLDMNGIEVIVEVTEQSTKVVVMVRCLKGSEIKCVKLRSSIIQQILSIKDNTCSKIKPNEFIIDPQCLTKLEQRIYTFPMAQVAVPIVRNEPYITLEVDAPSYNSENPFLLIKELLFFESYQDLGMGLLKEIFNTLNEKKTIPDDIFHRISVALQKNWRILAEVLHNEPQAVIAEVEADSYEADSKKCFKVFTLWAAARHRHMRTYSALRYALDHYSIYGGRAPNDCELVKHLDLAQSVAKSATQIAHTKQEVEYHDSLSHPQTASMAMHPFQDDTDTELVVDDHYDYTVTPTEHQPERFQDPHTELATNGPLSLEMPVLLKFPMAQGKIINIPQQISTCYRTFGIHLLNDRTGAIVVHKYREDSYQINIEILQRWIRGEGRKPVSWGTLTACLRDSELCELAGDIQRTLTHN